jgi:hypothetical protein
MKAKIIFNAVELQHLHKALERPLIALEAHPDPTLTFGFDVEIETPTSPTDVALATRRLWCPNCAQLGTLVGHLGLVACEQENCPVVLFKGAA